MKVQIVFLELKRADRASIGWSLPKSIHETPHSPPKKAQRIQPVR